MGSGMLWPMSDRLPITFEGKRALEEELKHLKSVERPDVIKAIEVARAHGDLSENADYSAARERQSFLEGRILDLEDKIARADVIDPKTIKSDQVKFGATVDFADENGQKKRYQIVGEPEADLAKGKISISSPLARALLGKRAGDEATLKTAKGESVLELISVEYI